VHGWFIASFILYTLFHNFYYRYLVEKAEQQKLATIISAEGDAKAAEMLAQAFKVGSVSSDD
jgi:hypothetical protein